MGRVVGVGFSGVEKEGEKGEGGRECNQQNWGGGLEKYGGYRGVDLYLFLFLFFSTHSALFSSKV